jgi:hypothetical protein
MHAEFNMSQIRFEQYRMQVIERWPESIEKQAALSAAQAVLVREVVFQTERCLGTLETPFSEVSGQAFADCAVD